MALRIAVIEISHEASLREIQEYKQRNEEFEVERLRNYILRITPDLPVSEDDQKKYWRAKCPKCDWKGLSRDCEAGGLIADTGDREDPRCPCCTTFVIDSE